MVRTSQKQQLRLRKSRAMSRKRSVLKRKHSRRNYGGLFKKTRNAKSRPNIHKLGGIFYHDFLYYYGSLWVDVG